MSQRQGYVSAEEYMRERSLRQNSAGQELWNKLCRRVKSGEISLEQALVEVERNIATAQIQMNQVRPPFERAQAVLAGWEAAKWRVEQEIERSLQRQAIDQSVTEQLTVAHYRLLNILTESRRQDITVARQKELVAAFNQAHAGFKAACGHPLVAQMTGYVPDDLGNDQSYVYCSCVLCGKRLASTSRKTNSLLFDLSEKEHAEMLFQPEWPLSRIIEFLKSKI